MFWITVLIILPYIQMSIRVAILHQCGLSSRPVIAHLGGNVVEGSLVILYNFPHPMIWVFSRCGMIVLAVHVTSCTDNKPW